MKLTLDPSDLKKKHQTREGDNRDQAISTSKVTFEHLNDAAQAAVRAVGRGTFYTWDEMTYNAVFPSKQVFGILFSLVGILLALAGAAIAIVGLVNVEVQPYLTLSLLCVGFGTLLIYFGKRL